MKKGNLLASGIVLIWGLAVLVYAATGSSSGHGSGAYNAGHTAGLAFAVLLVAAGARGLYKEFGKRGG